MPATTFILPGGTVTLAPSDPSTPLPTALHSFAVFSAGKTTMSSQSLVNGGAGIGEKFTTKEFDEEGADAGSGVAGIQAYHFGWRFYDPEVGVWNRPDPMDEFWNAYSYCGGNPIGFVDPM